MRSLPGRPGVTLLARAPLRAFTALAAFAVVAGAWSALAGLSFGPLVPVLIGTGLLAALGLYYDLSRRSDELADGAYICAQWSALIAVGIVFSYLAAHIGRPLYDSAFAGIDAVLGFAWRPWYEFVRTTPVLYWVLFLAYVSGIFQIVGSIAYFALTRQGASNQELWWTSFAAMFITALVSGIYPAMGAFFHFHENMVHAVHVPHLLALRDGSLSHFTDLQGIVTLPSYHTAQAILFMYAYRGQRRLFAWVVLLNALMLLSTPSMGGHYLVDMLAGAAVAGVSIGMVRHGLARQAYRQEQAVAAQ